MGDLAVNRDRFLVFSTMIDGPYAIKDLQKVVAHLKLKSDDVIWFSGINEWVILAQSKVLNQALPVSSERREFPRAPIDATVTLHNSYGSVFYGRIRNISAGGCLVHGLTQFKIGEDVRVVIRSANFSHSITCQAHIMRLDVGEGEATGCAIQFTDMVQRDRTIIAHYCDQVIQLTRELIDTKLQKLA